MTTDKCKKPYFYVVDGQKFVCNHDKGHDGICGPMGVPIPWNDSVNPSHYQGDSVMRFIEQFELNFCIGNAVKYLSRYKNKNGLEDLKKAQWYITREILKLSDATPPDEFEFTPVKTPDYFKVGFISALRATAAKSKGGHAYWMSELADELERT